MKKNGREDHKHDDLPSRWCPRLRCPGRSACFRRCEWLLLSVVGWGWVYERGFAGMLLEEWKSMTRPVQRTEKQASMSVATLRSLTTHVEAKHCLLVGVSV